MKKNVKHYQKTLKTANILLILTTILILAANTASAADYVVNPGENLQTAIDNPAVVDGDTINVTDGGVGSAIYEGNFIVNKSITITGQGNVTLIANNSAGAPSAPVVTFNGGSSNSILQNFIITGAFGPNGQGVVIDGVSGVWLFNNTITQNSQNGILVNGTGGNQMILQNTISENNGNGIVITDSQLMNGVYSNTIINNAQNGIHINIMLVTIPGISQTIVYNRIFNQTKNGFFDLRYDCGNQANVTYNWWGSNDNPWSLSKIGGVGRVFATYYPWMILVMSANPTIINNTEFSDITGSFNWALDLLGHIETINPAVGCIPEGTQLTFFTNLGSVGSSQITKTTTAGIATARLTADEGSGNAYISGLIDEYTTPWSLTIPNNTPHATVNIVEANISINKTANVTSANVGDLIQYSIGIKNNGPDIATSGVIRDAIPTGTEWVSGGDSHTATEIIWNIGAINPSIEFSVGFIVRVLSSAAGTTLTNIANITYNEYPRFNQSNTVNVDVIKADINITKFATLSTVNVGDIITYGINVKNDGPDIAHNLLVRDVIPDGTLWQSGGTHVGNEVQFTIPTLNPGQTIQCLFVVLTQPSASGTTVYNTANVTYDEYPAFNQSNTVGVYVKNAVVQLTKTASDNNPNVGSNVIFHVTATNNGPDTANNLVIKDILPTGLEFISADGGGNWDSINRVVTWSATSLLATQSVTYNITAKVLASVAGQTITNRANVTWTEYPFNNSTYLDITIPRSDVELNKTVNNTRPNVGESVTFTIIANNKGPSDAHNVMIYDTLPIGLDFVSATGGGTYDSLTRVITWIVGQLNNTKNVTFNVTATVNATAAGTTLNNTINETQTEHPFNVTNYVTLYVPKSEVYVTTTPTNIQTTVGKIVTITFKVGNKGPDDAQNVIMTFQIPEGMEYVTSRIDAGTLVGYDATTRTLTWNIGTIAAGADPYLWMDVKALWAGTFVIRSTIVSSTYNAGGSVFSPDVVVEAVAEKTIGMQSTGAPIVPLVVAMLLVISGLVIPRRK